jgi:hypothetical protein
MPSLVLVMNAEETGFDAMRKLAPPTEDRLADGTLIHLGNDAAIEIGGLEAGMASGRPSLAFCFTLPDGRVVLAETSLVLFLAAADAFRARFGDPR